MNRLAESLVLVTFWIFMTVAIYSVAQCTAREREAFWKSCAERGGGCVG